MSRPLVLSLGSVNADFQLRVHGPPEPGRTMLGEDFVRLGGGKAANVAFLARRLGQEARLLARVGGDEPLREQALGPLRAAGVDLAGVSVAADCATGVALIAVLPDGRKCILLAGNANDAWDEAKLRAAVAAVEAAPAGSVLVADYEVPAHVVARTAAVARLRGLPIVIDPSPAERVELAALSGTAAVTPNPVEAEGLTGIAVDGVAAAAEAAHRLRTLGVAMPCLKLGDGGCVVAWGGGMVAIPPPQVTPVDRTGAGDAFAGALAVALLERRHPREAACFAVAAASLAVTAHGSQPAYPARDEVERLLPSLLEAAHDLPVS